MMRVKSEVMVRSAVSAARPPRGLDFEVRVLDSGPLGGGCGLQLVGRECRRGLAARCCPWSWPGGPGCCPCLSSWCPGPAYAAAFGLGLAVQRAFIILPMRCSALALAWM
jgi:hypothetical protein